MVRPLLLAVIAWVALSLPARGDVETEQAGPNANPFIEGDASGSGWPFVRGPRYDGHSAETHLADGWPAQGPPVLWTRPLGQGYSGLVAWDGRVATQYQTLTGQYVICLDADTGETIWEHRYDWPYESAGVYPGPRSTPTYADGYIYFASPDGVIGCLTAGSGERRWSVDLRQFGSKGADFGYSCSPTVIDGKVILPVGGPGASMVALDAKTGSVVWKAGDDPASYTPAYPIRFQDRRLVLGYMQNALVCHDLETGDLVWRHYLSTGYDEHSAWPIYLAPYVWISSPFRAGSELLELTGDSEIPIKSLRKTGVMSNDIFSSVLIDGAIFGFDLRDQQAKTHRPSRGQFRCLDFRTGDEHWSTGDAGIRRRVTMEEEDAGQRIGHATVIVADGKLILWNDTGELILARAITERYEELGRVSVLSGEICWTQPSLHRGRLFVRNQSRAACIYLGVPELLPSDSQQAVLTVADIPQSKYVDLASIILGIEPEYAFDIPSDKWLLRWFVVTLGGIMGGSLLLVGMLHWLSGWPSTPMGMRWLFWTVVFIFGALGTTFASRWFNDFVFTWPVSIYVAFEAVIWEMRPRTATGMDVHRWRSRAVALGFIAICLAYFLMCRRLSLVFEWVFLCGFVGALPVALAGRKCFQGRRWSWAWNGFSTVAAYSAFYWSAAALLWLRR